MTKPKEAQPTQIDRCMATVGGWVVNLQQCLASCTERICVTYFVTQRLPHGMPVSAEEAKYQAREASMFFKQLFNEVSHHGSQI